jgi:Skp family chaperone for outer membrane proteins
MIFCLTAALTLGAQDSPRIGMLVPDLVIENSGRGRKLFSELEKLKKTLNDKIQAKGSELQKLSSQLQSPSISEAGREAIQKQLRDLDFENKKLVDDSNAELQKTQQRIVAQFQKELMPFVEELAKEQKLQLVLQYQPGMVAYADQTWMVSFSNEVARRYDAKFGEKTPAQLAVPVPVTAPKPGAPAVKPAQ